MHAEQLPGIGPEPPGVESGTVGQLDKTLHTVFVGVFAVQAFPGPKAKQLAFEGHGLRDTADQMHLDARLILIEKRAVNEARRIDVAVQFAANAVQQIQIEGRRDLGAVIVGSLQRGFVLEQVDPDQYATAGRQDVVQMAEQSARLFRGEIANAGAGEEHQRVLQGEVVGQLQVIGEIAAGCMHIEPGIIGGQAAGAVQQKILGDVDTQVAGWPQPFEQQANLAAGATAQLDQVALRADDLANLVRRVGEDAYLSTGQVVLRLQADLLEQLRAASVVEELGREVLGRSGEARQSFVAQGAIPGWQDVVVQLYSQCHSELPGQAQPGELPAHGRLEKVA